MPIRMLITALLAMSASPALAHPGGHGHMSLSEIVQHYAEPDHLAFLVFAALVGYAAYRYGRRIEAKAVTRKQPVDRP